MRPNPLVYALTLCIATSLFAQEKTPVKFGKVSLEDFNHKVYPIDSSANAVVIADVGYAEIVSGNSGSTAVKFEHNKRIHILNKNGYDAADVEIYLFKQGFDATETIESLKAVTYNVENGKIVETKLEKSSIFEDKINKGFTIKKFTFPAIKEGSIIEYQYTTKSDFVSNLQSWYFQGKYPTLWSEYNVSIPEFYYYSRIEQGYQPAHIVNDQTRLIDFQIIDNSGAQAGRRGSMQVTMNDSRYVKINVPAIKEEVYTSTINNHISKITFQLSHQQYPLSPRNYASTWNDVARRLLEAEYFGDALKRNNGWLSDEVKNITQKSNSDIEKAYAIFSYLRNNFTCTSHSNLFISSDLKSVFKNKNGNEAEINLLLIAMLNKAGIQADPVILSTRQHGYVLNLYPNLEKFNYVVARVAINDKALFLDASEPALGFGRINDNCYNGMARLVTPEAPPIYFSPDSLKETSVTSLMFFSDEKGHLSGNINYNAGYAESFEIRKNIKDKGKESVINTLKKEISTEAEVKEVTIDSLSNLEEPLTLHFNVDLKEEGEDIIYFNPVLAATTRDNPFKSAERFYPVEMPFVTDENILARVEVPKGYTVDEMPKSVRMKMNEEGDGVFEYLIQNDGGVISLRSRILIKRTLFMPEDYEMLREFYNLVVKKYNEQIVFKKKN